MADANQRDAEVLSLEVTSLFELSDRLTDALAPTESTHSAKQAARKPSEVFVENAQFGFAH